MFKRNKKARYSAHQSQTCASNHSHHSCQEAQYCNQLAALKRAGEIKDYTSQVRYDLVVNGKHITTHIPDFLVTNNDGTQHIEEYKGFATEIFRLKWKLFQACYPDIPYIIKTAKDLW